MTGDGENNNIEMITKLYLKLLFQKLYKYKIQVLDIFHPLQYMESVIMDFKEEEMFIIGVYGQENLNSKIMQHQ